MTEADWMTCEDVRKLLEYLVERTSDRKFRLFGCACCRRVWCSLADNRGRRAVSTAERYVDGLATETEMNAVRRDMITCRCETALSPGRPPADSWASAAAEAVLFDTPFWKPNAASQGAYTAAWTAAEAAWRANGETGPNAEARRQLLLLRDIFENPYRPSWVEPAWLRWSDGAVGKFAQVVYDDRAFDRLPLLADALEDAGCTDAAMLGHLRGQGPHVRGCWVLDALLGKS